MRSSKLVGDLTRALLELEAHHVEQNRKKFRPGSESRTLGILRKAMALVSDLDTEVILSDMTISQLGSRLSSCEAALEDVGDMSKEILRLAARVKKLEAEKDYMCDVCADTGKPLSGLPCICGGTGSGGDEKAGLRLHCFNLDEECATLQSERDAFLEVIEQLPHEEWLPGWMEKTKAAIAKRESGK